MSAGLRGWAGTGPGVESVFEGPLLGHLALCGRIRSLTGTPGFLALAAERSAGVGDSGRVGGTGFVASSLLGCGPVGIRGLVKPGKGCSPSEEWELGNCYVGKYPALCEITGFRMVAWALNVGKGSP